MMWNNLAIRYGLAAGIGTVAYFLLFYLISPRYMLAYWVWWSSIIIYVVAMVKSIKDEMARSRSSFGFREGLRASFLTFIIANAVFYLFYYLLFSVFDPQLVEMQRELMQNSPGLAGGMEGKSFEVTPGKTFFVFSYTLIGGFILSLVLAGLIVRNGISRQ